MIFICYSWNYDYCKLIFSIHYDKKSCYFCVCFLLSCVIRNNCYIFNQKLIWSCYVFVAEDDDIFQCGRCKKQFTSLPAFVSHKQSRCAPPQILAQNQLRSVPTSNTSNNVVAATVVTQTPVLAQNVSYTNATQPLQRQVSTFLLFFFIL